MIIKKNPTQHYRPPNWPERQKNKNKKLMQHTTHDWMTSQNKERSDVSGRPKQSGRKLQNSINYKEYAQRINIQYTGYRT